MVRRIRLRSKLLNKSLRHPIEVNIFHGLGQEVRLVGGAICVGLLLFGRGTWSDVEPWERLMLAGLKAG